MKKVFHAALVGGTFIALALSQSTAFARAASNVGGGMTCYNYPVVNADGTVSYQRLCFKRG